jgi:hypothetical protein
MFRTDVPFPIAVAPARLIELEGWRSFTAP